MPHHDDFYINLLKLSSMFSLSLDPFLNFFNTWHFFVFNEINSLPQIRSHSHMLIISLKGKGIAPIDSTSNRGPFFSRSRGGGEGDKPKDPGRILWKIRHWGCLDSSSSVLLQVSCARKKHREKTGYFKPGVFCDGSLCQKNMDFILHVNAFC